MSLSSRHHHAQTVLQCCKPSKRFSKILGIGRTCVVSLRGYTGPTHWQLRQVVVLHVMKLDTNSVRELLSEKPALARQRRSPNERNA